MKPGDLCILSSHDYDVDADEYLGIYEFPPNNFFNRDRDQPIGKMHFGETGIFLDHKTNTNWYKLITSSGIIGWLYTLDLEEVR